MKIILMLVVGCAMYQISMYFGLESDLAFIGAVFCGAVSPYIVGGKEK